MATTATAMEGMMATAKASNSGNGWCNGNGDGRCDSNTTAMMAMAKEGARAIATAMAATVGTMATAIECATAMQW